MSNEEHSQNKLEPNNSHTASYLNTPNYDTTFYPNYRYGYNSCTISSPIPERYCEIEQLMTSDNYYQNIANRINKKTQNYRVNLSLKPNNNLNIIRKINNHSPYERKFTDVETILTCNPKDNVTDKMAMDMVDRKIKPLKPF